MKICLGDYEFDLGDECKKFEMLLPFDLDGVDLSIKFFLVIEKMEEDNPLHFYSCGDILHESGSQLSDAECNSKVQYKISIVVKFNQEAAEEKYVVVACEAHAFILTYQVLFMLGLGFGKQLGMYSDPPSDKGDE